MELPFMYKYKPILFTDFEIDENIIKILNTLISMNNLNSLGFTHNGRKYYIYYVFGCPEI